MSYYVIQSKTHHWDTAWTTWPDRRFDTLKYGLPDCKGVHSDNDPVQACKGGNR